MRGSKLQTAGSCYLSDGHCSLACSPRVDQRCSRLFFETADAVAVPIAADAVAVLIAYPPLNITLYPVAPPLPNLLMGRVDCSWPLKKP